MSMFMWLFVMATDAGWNTPQPTTDPTANTIALEDRSWNPSYLLGECMGHCVNDTSCRGSFSCFQNTNDAVPPGCHGTVTSGMNYCYDASNSWPTPSPAWTTAAPEPALEDLGWYISANDLPLDECQGDCDSDDECDGDLVCYQSDYGDTVPGCSGTASNNYQYCYSGTPYPTLYPTTHSPTKATDVEIEELGWGSYADGTLGHCQGDCDDDDECQDGLICFHDDLPPGCKGTPSSSYDFCYDPLWASNDTFSPTSNPTTHPTPQPIDWTPGPTTNPTGQPTMEGYKALKNFGWSPATPLYECEGDCDNDGDCDGQLLCQHDESPIGCQGDYESGMDYCYNPYWPDTFPPTTDPTTAAPSVDPTPFPTMVDAVTLVFRDWSPYGTLGECIGDCDDDDDCRGTMKCFQNSGYDLPPGCKGNVTSGADYCVKSDYIPTAEPTTEPTIGPWCYPQNKCDDGYMDSTNGDYQYWSCGSGCVGGAYYTDVSCNCACVAQSECNDTTTTPQPSSPTPQPTWPTPQPIWPTQQPAAATTTPKPTRFLTWTDKPTVDPTVGTDPILQDFGHRPSNLPLYECQGDCDSDDECNGTLSCYQLSVGMGYSVPGCSGTSSYNYDYCYYAATTSTVSFAEWLSEGMQFIKIPDTLPTSFVIAMGLLVFVVVAFFRCHFWKKQEKSYKMVGIPNGNVSDSETEVEEVERPMV